MKAVVGHSPWPSLGLRWSDPPRYTLEDPEGKEGKKESVGDTFGEPGSTASEVLTASNTREDHRNVYTWDGRRGGATGLPRLRGRPGSAATVRLGTMRAAVDGHDVHGLSFRDDS